MAQQDTPTAEQVAIADVTARESSPLPWSQPAYYNVAVDPAPQHALDLALRVAAVAHGGNLYNSDYGPVETPIDLGWTRKVNGIG